MSLDSAIGIVPYFFFGRRSVGYLNIVGLPISHCGERSFPRGARLVEERVYSCFRL